MMKSDVLQSLKSTNMRLSFSVPPLAKWVLTILILGTGIALMAYFYTHEQSQNHELQEQVDKAATTLVQNNLAMRDLEGQLAEARLNLAELQAMMPSARQTMTVEEKLFQAATDAGVTINSISVSDPKSISDGAYQAFGVSVSVLGGVENQLRFSGVLGHWLPTAEIVTVSTSGEGMSLALNVYVQ